MPQHDPTYPRPSGSPQAYLSVTNKDGVSLHSHLAEVIQELLASKDPDALSKLESISLDVKAKHFKPAMGVTPVAPSIEDDGWKKRSNALFQAATGEEDTGVPNVVETMSFFEFAGVGLAREESFRLFLAMGGLKAAYDLKSVRFFGKILGTKKDYYVVEGEYKTAPAAAAFEGEGTAPEAPGTGLNKCAYFVASGASDPFELLPDVTPAQVLASSTIKKYFSGDLSAPLLCSPPFPGAEKEYLRAQIARISAATVLVPAGKLALEEVEEGPAPIIPAEDYEAKPAAEMAELENWVRLYGGILKIGRCTNVPKVAVEGEEEAEEVELEEEVPPLGALGGDAPVATPMEEEEVPAWTTKVYNKQGADYAIAVAKSYRWPGAYAVAMKADKAANLYIGYGHENTGTTFTPIAPPPILGEAADVEEQADVTLDAENALLKSIEESKMVAEGEEPAEEE